MYTILIAGHDSASSKLIRERMSLFSGLKIIAETQSIPEMSRLLARTKPDVLFFDVHLCGSAPFEFLRKMSYSPLLIITSADRSHALDAYDHNALDFLIKPLERERLDGSLRKLIENAVPADKIQTPILQHLFVPDGNGFSRIDTCQIRYIRAARDYSVLYTEGREWISSVGIGRIMQKLDNGLFKRVHRSYIVNLTWVEHMVKIGPQTSVFIKDGPEIMVGRSYLPILKPILL